MLNERSYHRAFKSIRKYSSYIYFICILLFLPDNAHSQFLMIEEINVIYKNTESFEDDVLISALGLNESDIYKPKILGNNVFKLQKFYFDNGFFDAKIDTIVKYDLVEEEVFIDIIVYENKHYKIDSLIYIGLNNVTGKPKTLLSKVKVIKPKGYYDKTLVSQQTNDMIEILQNNGFMNARLKPDSGTVVRRRNHFNEASLSVTINFLGADSIFYFGKTDIKIVDNKYGVDEGLLKKEITYKDGEIYSKEKKLETERNITKIPIVQSTRISPDEIVNEKVDFRAEVILNKKTEISPYGEATVIDNIFYMGGGVQYINKYFLGGGKILNINFDGLINSFDVNRIEFSTALTQPHVFNNKSYLTDKVTIGLYNVENSQNYYLGNLTSYLQSFTEYTFYNNASVDLTEELVRIKYDTTQGNPLTVFNTILSTTFVHDNTNDVFSPSKGFFHSITVGSAGLIPKLVINLFKPNVFYSQYVKLFTSNNFYFNISRRPKNTVLATKFQVGDIIEYGSGERLIPLQPFYKFYSGGSSSVRGWGAKDNSVAANSLDGGDFLLEGSIELRQKLFPRAENFKKNISAAFFLDYGNVWPTDDDFRLDQIALAIGFGVRYNLFIGPVRVDFGFKLYDPMTGANAWLFNDFSSIFSDRFVVHFGIGEAF
ncbi:MAG: BamA/TamA family outer membrane protein [Bacteroidota bacterium]|nr:BamA/TamA family outer membrane protein [Bacteroidota bacterium]